MQTLGENKCFFKSIDIIKEIYPFIKKEYLMKEFPGIPLILILTTHVGNAEDEKRVIVQNRWVSEIAEKYGLRILNLFSESLTFHDHLDEDGVHFGDTANAVLGEKIAE